MTIRLLLGCILLTGCSLFKSSDMRRVTERHERNLAVRHERISANDWRKLDTSMAWRRDSSVYVMDIQTRGPFRIHPDSGIQGRNAQISVSAMRMTTGGTNSLSKSQGQTTGVENLDLSAGEQHLIREKKRTSQQWGNGLGTLGVVALLLMVYLWWKRAFSVRL